MQILVFSDSHNDIAPMEAKVREIEPDLILHLGDYEKDAKALARLFPHIPLRLVRGNCDLGSESPNLENFVVAKRCIHMTHGHHFHVKSSYAALIDMGHSAKTDILLFGHTHIPHYEQLGAMHVLNPGSARESCALILIQDGGISCQHLSLSVYADL